LTFVLSFDDGGLPWWRVVRAGVQAAHPVLVAAMVLSICRVTVRHAARTSAGAAIGWSRAVNGSSTLVVDPAVDQGEGHPVTGQPVGIDVATFVRAATTVAARRHPATP
jgi:hypothetical protein